MRRLRILLALLLVLAAALALGACGKGGGKKTAVTTAPDGSVPGATVDVVKGGKSSYRLVTPQRSPAGFEGLSDIGMSLRSYVSSAYGVSLTISNDAKAAEAGTPEILIGDTNRPETAAVAARLAEIAAADTLYYVVAEANGQIVLYANDSRMYRGYENAKYERCYFLYDYFVASYATADGIAVPKGCFDVQSITVTAYNAMMREIEDEIAANADAERLQQIAALKAEVKAFRIADFGRIEQDIDSIYSEPKYTPTKGSHPRILVNETTLLAVRERFAEAARTGTALYRDLMKKVEADCTGLLKDTPEGTSNYTTGPLSEIESKAFYYMMTGDEVRGYEAILAMKNYLITFEIYSDRGDNCRDFGYIMYIAACVYDWCYDLMTPGDRNQFIAAIHTRIGPNMEVGFPPKGQGGVTGHGSETQVLRDYLAFAIASYDERPWLYNYCAGRIQEVHVPPINWFGQSGSHWQGTNYGPFRYACSMYAELLMHFMSGGEYHFFDQSVIGEISRTFLYYRRPDNQMIYIGDTGNQGVLLGQSSTFAAQAFYVASILGDENLMANSLLYYGQRTPRFSWGGHGITYAMYFLVYDPDVFGDDPTSEEDAALPLVRYAGSPLGTIFARSAWNDKDAVSVYMKIGEAYSANHEHKDAGTFQIFYKGNLASDSGIYDTYVNPHGAGYYRQSVSSNTLLIYNPTKTSADKWIYSGGQSIHKEGARNENSTLAQWLSRYTSSQAEIIGHDYLVTDDGAGGEEYLFSYLAGDLTDAYDADTVDEVSRYMISIMTGDPDNPMAFIVFDRITSVDASFKKTFLLHVQEKPTINNETQTAVITNTKTNAGYDKIGYVNNGKLYVQSLLTDVNYFMVGGSAGEEVNGVVNKTDMQFAVYSQKPIYQYDAETGKWTSTGAFTELGYHNYPAYEYVSDRYQHTPENGAYDPVKQLGSSTHEYGWGRIEISPREAALTDRLLTVMYVTDADNDAPQVMASEIENEYFVGAIIFGKAVLFPVDGGVAYDAEMTFTVSGEVSEYYVAGLGAGRWEISVDGVLSGTAIVSEDGILRLPGTAGQVTLTPCFSTIEFDLGGGRLNAGVTLPDAYNYGDVFALPTADTTAEFNFDVDVTKLGSVFLGWYTNPALSGEPVTAITADMRGPQKFYAKWEWRFSVVDYDPMGGTIGELYDYHLLENATLIPPREVTREGYYFGGWYTDPDCTGERVTVVTTALADADGNVTLYADWRLSLLYEGFESEAAQTPYYPDSPDQVRGGISYQISGMEGASFVTLTDGSGNRYLRWVGGSDTSGMYVLGQLGESVAASGKGGVTIVLDLARLESIAATRAVLRLRGSSAAGAAESAPLLHVGANGEVYLGFGTGTVLTTLGTGFSEIAVSVDFESGALTGYVNGERVAATTVKKPASIGEMSLATWLASLDKYVFDLNATTPNDGEVAERTLLLDNVRVYVGAYVKK